MGSYVHGSHSTEWVTISLDEYESMKATIETLSNSEAMVKIMHGETELAAGKGKPLTQVKKELGL